MTAPDPAAQIMGELLNNGDTVTINADGPGQVRTGSLRAVVMRVLADFSRFRAVGTFRGRLGDLTKAKFGLRDDVTRSHYLLELIDQKVDKIARELKVDVSDLQA